MKIAIVGGGMGGMTLALALADAGLRDVDMYESAPAIRELGVGIDVPRHGVRELDELGLLDARVLARELALRPSIEAAVSAYDGRRRPATAAVVLANRQEGPVQCQNLVEERAPDGFANLDAVVSRRELEEIASRYRRGAGFDPAVLNGRPSLSVRP